MNPEPTTAQVTVRLVARLPMGRQQMIAGSNEQNKQFDPGKCFCRGASRFVFCILYATFCFCLSAIFLCFSMTAGEGSTAETEETKRVLMGENDGHENMIDEEHCLRSSTIFLIKTASCQFYFLNV